MDYVCGPVILYSQDKIRMMDFLSDVFEFDVDSENDLVENGALHLKLIELKDQDKEHFKSSGIKFAFKLKNSDQLKEILNKFNFFLYRKSDLSIRDESFDLKQDDTYLSITDLDGRVWQFDVEKSL